MRRVGTNFPLEAIEAAVRALASLTLPKAERIETAISEFFQSRVSLLSVPDAALPHIKTIDRINDKWSPIAAHADEISEAEVHQLSEAFVSLFKALAEEDAQLRS